MTETSIGRVTGSDIPGPSIALLASMPRVDLMPPEVAEGEALRRLQIGCVAALIACAAAVGGVWFQAHSTVGSAKKNLTATQAEKNRVNAQVASLSNVAAAFAAAENGKKLIQQALGGEVRWSTQLRDLGITIPPNIWLTSMNIAAGGTAPATGTTSTTSTGSTASTGTTATSSVATVTFQGTASSRYDIANWLNTISGMKGYVGVTYSTSQEKVLAGQVHVDFTSTVTLTSDVLSHRYTNLNGS